MTTVLAPSNSAKTIAAPVADAADSDLPKDEASINNQWAPDNEDLTSNFEWSKFSSPALNQVQSWPLASRSATICIAIPPLDPIPTIFILVDSILQPPSQQCDGSAKPKQLLACIMINGCLDNLSPVFPDQSNNITPAIFV